MVTFAGVVGLLLVLGLAGLVFVEGIGAQQNAGGELGRLRRRHFAAGQFQDHRHIRRLAQVRAGKSAKPQKVMLVEVADGPRSDDIHAVELGPGRRQQLHGRSEFAFEIGRGKGARQRARRVTFLRRIAKLAAIGGQYDGHAFGGRRQFRECYRRS